MKKKIIGLNILLLVLLLSLSTTCYASNFTETEFSNLIANILTNFGERDISETIVTNLKNTNIVSTLLDLQNTYDYLYINEYGLPTNRIDFYFSNDNSTYVYKSGKTFYFKGNGRYTISINNSTGVFQNTYSNLSSTISNQTASYLIYSDRDIYNNSSGTTKLYDSGFLDNEIEWLDDLYFPDKTYLQFYPEATTQSANVYVFENVPLYTKSNNENLLIGMLAVPNETTITDVLVERFYYNGQNYVPKVLSQDINNNYITYNLYQTDNKQKAYNIYFNKNSLYDNNIYLIEWKDKTKEPYEWTQAVFYIKNNKTAIINGEINPVVTFSGDTNIGNNNIIDNQNDNNDFWKNVYNEMFTLNSGEATQMLDNFITNTNLGEIGTLSGELMTLNLLNGEPSDFIISWNDVVIPNLKNNEPKLLIPQGNINFTKLSVTLGNETYTSPKAQDVVDVMGYVRIILGYTIVVLLIANIWETLMHVLGVGTAIYEDNADEKAELYNVDLDTGKVNYTQMHKIPSKKQTWFYHRKG